MLIIMLCSGLAFCIIFFAIILVIRSRTATIVRSKQALGIQWLKSLRVFLAKVQKHRGLSSGYLNGETSLLPEINRLQASINEDAKLIQGQGAWMEENERWRNTVEHWGKLSKKFNEYDSTNNLNQHHWMIQNILYLIEDMADEHSLIRLKGEGKHNVEFLWRDLLQTIEYMGQARAIGTGAAAVGACGSVDRIKLNYLHKKIERGAAFVLDELPNQTGVQAKVSLLLEYIDSKILASKCEVSAGDYFAIATNALEGLYAHYDLTVNRLSKR